MLLELKKKHLEKERLFYAKRNYLWATELSMQFSNGTTVGSCMRKAFFSITGTPESNKTTARGQRIMATGKLIEKNEQAIDKAAGIYVAGNFKFYLLDWNVSGEVDEIALLDGDYYILEYKTGYGPYFKRAVAKGPKEDHLIQGMPYLKAFMDGGVNCRYPIKGLIYAYFDRGDPSKQWEHLVTLGERGGHKFPVVNGVSKPAFNFSLLDARKKELEGYVSTGELPPRDFDNTHWLCKSYCNFRSHCKKLDRDGPCPRAKAEADSERRVSDVL
jgi:hypothetical protein